MSTFFNWTGKVIRSIVKATAAVVLIPLGIIAFGACAAVVAALGISMGIVALICWPFEALAKFLITDSQQEVVFG